jgi:tetratricopeptide (TPR) repeat protein
MKNFQKTDRYILYSLLFLLPLFLLPIFANPFVTAKLVLLVFLLGIILITKGIRSIASSNISLSLGRFDIPVIITAIAYTASSILQTPNKMEAYFLPGITTFIVGGSIIYFLLNQEGDEVKKVVKKVLLLSGAIFSLITISATTGIFKLIPPLPAYAKDISFNTDGSILSGVMLLVPLLPIAFEVLKDEKNTLSKVIFGIGSTIVLFGVIATIFNLVFTKDQNRVLPPLSTSWVISVETLKVTPILGIGPGNYLTAFNLFRPISYNQTNLWPLRFASASNFYLTALTETGLLGFGGIIILILSFFKSFREKIWNTNIFNKLPSALLLIMIAILPPSPTTLVMLFVYMALATKVHKMNLNTLALSHSQQETGETSVKFAKRIPSLTIFIPIFIVVLYSFLSLTTAAIAEAKYKNALDAINRNDGKLAYDTLISTINTNPNVDRYHSTYAQLNLALANSIAKKESLTDTDKQTVSQLIQQAIREGKSAVSLNPQRSGNWELLGSIYRSIINVAKDADKFSIQTYSQAISLDPMNPNLRIILGGIYHQIKNYDSAIDTFKLASVAKPNLANAHYNLAIAYKDKGDTQNAINEIQTVLNLLDKNSNDYKLAQKTLDDLQKNKDIKPQQGENLAAPQETQLPIKEKINLPQDATPPASPKPESPKPAAP